MRVSTIFFDDVCVLCSWSVRLIFKNDPRGKFHFASTDSEAYRKLLQEMNHMESDFPDSIVLLHNQKLFTKSCAVFRITAFMRFPWPLLAVFLLIPRFLRNAVYDLFARNRYRWFGKREICFVPPADLKERFISDI